MQGATATTHPFSASFECARGHGSTVEASHFAPARVTPRPRIVGSQTAFVTDDPSSKGAEIMSAARRARRSAVCGSASTGTPTRPGWARAELLLGAGEPGVRRGGEGALWHRRVGCEVIVEHLDGDPDRPIVTGRVYNGQNRPPGPASGAATVSI